MGITATKQARQVVVDIDLQPILKFVTEGNSVPASKCVKGLPIDAEFVRLAFPDFTLATLTLIFEHESFDEVRVGSSIPIFELEFEQI